MFFNYKDKSKLQGMIVKSRDGTTTNNNTENTKQGMSNLLSCVEYCLDEVRCRQEMVLSYFGEVFHAVQCTLMILIFFKKR
jgi:superfamily II DNA helicase RecQ